MGSMRLDTEHQRTLQSRDCRPPQSHRTVCSNRPHMCKSREYRILLRVYRANLQTAGKLDTSRLIRLAVLHWVMHVSRS